MKIETDLDGAWIGIPVGLVCALFACVIACSKVGEAKRKAILDIQTEAVKRGVGHWIQEQPQGAARFEWIEVKR